MSVPYTYYYNGQIRNYIAQFLRVFSGFQVEYAVDRDGDGKKDRRAVEIRYGNADRMVSVITRDAKTFYSQHLPVISGYLRGIRRDDVRNLPHHHVDRVVVEREGEGRRVLHRAMPVPVKLEMELGIYASSTGQVLEILEQILLLFNPSLNIETSDDLIDHTYISKVVLTSIGNQDNYPIGSSQRVLIQTLTFEVDAWLNYPAKETNNIIEQIITNIKDDTITPVDLDTFEVPEDNE